MWTPSSAPLAASRRILTMWRQRGQVKLGGMEWTARSTSGDPISVGTEVRVDRVEGVKVYVTPVEAAVTV